MTAFVRMSCGGCRRTYGGLVREGEVLACPSCGWMPGPGQCRLFEESDVVKAAGEMRMPFGRYKRRPLREILREHTGYFEWLACECRIENAELKDAVRTLWTAYFKAGGRGERGEQGGRVA